MKTYAALLGLILLAAHPARANTIAAFFTSGTYDDTGEANAVDREAASNAKPLAEFKADVAAAFRSGTGGVITFDRAVPGIDPNGSSGRSGNYPGSTLTIFYGPGHNASLEMSVDLAVVTDRKGRSLSRLDVWQGNRLGPTPISGPLLKHNGSPATAGAFLTPGTDIDDDTCAKLNFSGGKIRQLGLTALSGAAKQELTVTAYFSGGDAESRTESVGDGPGKDDVFFYFAAPDRQTIVSILWDSDVQSRPGIDDLAFLFDAAAQAECVFILR